MKQELRAALAAALRSGRYKQGTNALHYIKDGTHYYCCLGVACEVAIEHGVEVEVRRDEEGNYRYNGNTAALPVIVCDAYGFSHALGAHHDKYGNRYELAYDNDHGYDFARIADIIESGAPFNDDA